MKKLLLSIFFLGCNVALAAPTKEGAAETFTLETLGGKKYVGAKVVGVDPDGIRIVHQDGAGKVAFTDVSKELQQQYGYDAGKATEFESQQKTAQKTAQEVQARLVLASAEEQELASFNLFRRQVLESLSRMDYNYAELDALLLKWIALYKENDKKAWVTLLEADRKLLQARELQRPQIEANQRNKELEAQNAQLQEQIKSLTTAVNETRTALNDQRTTQRVSIYDNPYPYSYYYRQPIYVRPPVVICPTPPVVRPRPVPMQTYTGGAGGPVGVNGAGPTRQTFTGGAGGAVGVGGAGP